MTIVNPLTSSNLVVQATATPTRPEERQNDLRVEQIVRATVVEGGLDRATLELKHQRFSIQTDQELQTGQQLKLQVMTTHPKLSFKLLALPMETRLNTLLPLLAKPFDWNGLLQQIQQGTGPHSGSMKQVITQLSALLRPAPDLPAKDLAAVASTLEQLKTSKPLFSGANGPPLTAAFERLLSAINLRGEVLDLPQQLKTVALQIRQQPELMREFRGPEQERIAGLLSQIEQAQKPLQPAQARLLASELNAHLTAAAAPSLAQLKTLQTGTNGPIAALDRLLSTVNLRAVAPALPQQLKAIALQIRQQPELMRELMGAEQEKVAGLLSQIEQTKKPLQPEQARLLASELKSLLVAGPTPLPQGLSRAAQELQLLLKVPENLELSPALRGHLKDLVDQLKIAVATKSVWPQELQQQVQQMLGTMQPLIAEPEILVQGGKLGLLSQLFGLNLEAELLRGRTKDALSSLKLALLGERAELGSKGEEALHRLELFQICRVRLGEQGLTFVPLPLPFLEEGFMLVEENDEQNQQQKEDESTRLSLHLKLSALGNLQIDMLTEPSGILLRVACEDQQRVNFLQSQSDQLQERLQELKIRGVSFTTGVESPAHELLKRILPNSHGMLDARA
jgi:hypothetical protein